MYNFTYKNIPTAKQLELIKQYKDTGDVQIKEDIILANIKLVYKLVNKYCSDDSYLDDCVSVGVITLSKAIDYFDIDNKHNACFSTYAAKSIIRAIWRFIDEQKPIADMSLDEPIFENDYGDTKYLKDAIADTSYNDTLELEEELNDIFNFIDNYFQPRTKLIFYYKFGLFDYPKLKEQEIAERVNTSRANVANYYAKGLKAIRKYLNENIKPRRKI